MAGKTPIYEPLAAGDEDNWDIPIADMKQLSGGIKIFNNNTERDAWASKYPSRLPDTIALVGNGENKYPSWYKWETTWHFAGYFGGLVIADVDGALTHVDSTAVLGPDFKLQAAGDTGQGVLIMLSDEVKAEIAKKTASMPSFKVGPYLELAEDPMHKGQMRLNIKPMTFELRKTPGYLAYMQYPELIYGKMKEGADHRKGTIWPDMTRVSAEGMLQVDRNNKAIGLQETDMKDPNITGGSKFLVWPFIYLEGTAPDDGYVELIMYKKSDGSIATDIGGHPLAVRHNYKQGQELTPAHAPLMLAQCMAAKGLTEYSLALVDNFDEYVKVLDYSEGPTGLCVQELSKDGSTSQALLQAEVDTGFNIRMESYYLGTYLASINYLTGIAESATTIKGGSKAHTVAGIEMYAITDTEFAVSQGMLEVNSSGKAVTDFYIALELSKEVSRLVAGRELVANLALQDKDDGWEIGFFNYSGSEPRPPIYSARNNGSIILNTGWTKITSDFITEDAVSGLHSHTTPSVTVPKNADQILVAIYPVQAQQPCDLYLKSFHLDAVNPEELFSVNSIAIAGLQHLDFMSKTVRLVQGVSNKDSTGKVHNQYAALRYTDGPGNGSDGIPMPLGMPERKLQYLTLDSLLM